MFRKKFSIYLAVIIFASLLIPQSGKPCTHASVSAEAFPGDTAGNVFIQSNPSHLSGSGMVTVSVTITNTNPAAGRSRSSAPENTCTDELPEESVEESTGEPTAQPTGEPTAQPTGEPTEEPSAKPTGEIMPTPTPSEGSYTNIRIHNSYGVFFNTIGASIPAGTSKTFRGMMSVPNEQIGVPLSFYVSWFDMAAVQESSYELNLIIARGDTVHLKLTRTASRKTAAPGETITLKYTIVNTGAVTLNEIKLVDKEIAGSGSMLQPFTLSSGQSVIHEHVYTMGNSTVVSKPTAAFIPEGSTAPLSVTASDLTLGLELLQLTKEVHMGTPTENGVLFTIYLTNNGNKRLGNLIVSDELGNKITEAFNLAVGETKIIEYNIPNPEGVRNVVFTMDGNYEDGGVFRDHTASFAIRPYIDPARLGLDFKVQIRTQLDANNMIGLTFTVTNTGSVDYSDITLTEETLGYELHKIDTLTTADGSVSFDLNVNVGGERELVFILEAFDTSGDMHTYNAHITAAYFDPSAVFPNKPPSAEGPAAIEDISGNFEKWNTAIGEKLVSLYSILAVISIVLLSAVIVLFAVELYLKKKAKTQRRRNG